MSSIVLSSPISITVFEWVVCDLVGVLWREAKKFLIGSFRLFFHQFWIINEAKGEWKMAEVSLKKVSIRGC